MGVFGKIVGAIGGAVIGGVVNGHEVVGIQLGKELVALACVCDLYLCIQCQMVHDVSKPLLPEGGGYG